MLAMFCTVDNDGKRTFINYHCEVDSFRTLVDSLDEALKDVGMPSLSIREVLLVSKYYLFIIRHKHILNIAFQVGNVRVTLKR